MWELVSLLFVGVRDVQWSFQVSKTKSHVADTAFVTLPVLLLSLALGTQTARHCL